MKKIECYLRQNDAWKLLETLSKSGVNGATVSPVQGFGRQRGRNGHALPKSKVEILALDIEVNDVIDTITTLARKGKYGDGKIAILELAGAVRIRTGESGPKALM